MKKSTKIILNICIIFILILFILILEEVIRGLSQNIEHLSQLNKNEILDDWEKEYMNNLSSYIIRLSTYTVLGFLAIGACGFIFVCVNPKLFRRSTWTNLSEEWKQNKSERTAAKQAKAEEEKQKQIAKLEKKLDELKKDGE